MKKEFCVIIISLLFSSTLFSQLPLAPRQDDAPKQKFTDKMFFGGGFSLQFGSSQTYVECAPMVGYKLTEKFSVGLNLKYIYLKIHDGSFKYSTNIYAGGPFARFFIFEGLFAHAEYEILNRDVPNLYGPGYHRENINSVFVGGGYRQMIGNNSAFDILILYNINESNNSPYVNPIFRFGFAIGI